MSVINFKIADLKDLDKLLELLREHEVKEFTQENLKITFVEKYEYSTYDQSAMDAIAKASGKDVSDEEILLDPYAGLGGDDE